MGVIEEFIAGSITWLAPLLLILLRLQLGFSAAEMIDSEEERAEMRTSELVQSPGTFGFGALGLVSVAAVRAYTASPGRGPFLFTLVFVFLALFAYTLFFGFKVSRTGVLRQRELRFALGLSIAGLLVAAITTAS